MKKKRKMGDWGRGGGEGNKTYLVKSEWLATKRYRQDSFYLWFVFGLASVPCARTSCSAAYGTRDCLCSQSFCCVVCANSRARADNFHFNYFVLIFHSTFNGVWLVSTYSFFYLFFLLLLLLSGRGLFMYSRLFGKICNWMIFINDENMTIYIKMVKIFVEWKRKIQIWTLNCTWITMN